MKTKPYSVYMVRCKNGALYCGITLDVPGRVNEHNTVPSKASRYTWAHRPVMLVYVEKLVNRSKAVKREVEIKHLKKQEKEALVRVFATKKSI